LPTWAALLSSSRDRATLRRALRTGLAAGLKAPRPNDEVLREAWWPSETASATLGKQLPPGQPFALLISTWRGDRADYLREAFVSSVHEQTRRPAQVVLVQDGRVYFRSDAPLRIARGLRFPWPLFTAFVVVPRFVRDWAYDFIAARRYRWFGRRDVCMIPTPELRSRFISEPGEPANLRSREPRT